MSKKERVMVLKLSDIFIDPELKVRVETDEATAKEYYDAMETGEDVKKFPKPTVYFDGCRYMLVDGHHRYLAATWRGFETMEFIVIDGTRDEAILAAVKLNLTNGLRFNEGDWEKIVSVIGGKEQWRGWSNRRLAEELGCSAMTVQRYRPESSGVTAVTPEKRMGKDGKMYPVKVKKKEDAVATESFPAEETVAESQAVIAPTTEETGTTAGREVVEASLPEQTEKSSSDDDRRRIEANVKETQILATISQLQTQIAEWFEIAPQDMFEGFDKRLRKRIGELID